MRTTRLAVMVAALVLGACGRGSTAGNLETTVSYPDRIATLRSDSVLHLPQFAPYVEDHGETTECIDPDFDRQIPSVWTTYRVGDDARGTLDRLRGPMENAGWKFLDVRPFGDEWVSNYEKEFGSWTSIADLTTDGMYITIDLQAGDGGACT